MRSQASIENVRRSRAGKRMHVNQSDLMKALRDLYAGFGDIERRLSRIDQHPEPVDEAQFKPLDALDCVSMPTLSRSLVALLESFHTILQRLDTRLSRLENLPHGIHVSVAPQFGVPLPSVNVGGELLTDLSQGCAPISGAHEFAPGEAKPTQLDNRGFPIR